MLSLFSVQREELELEELKGSRELSCPRCGKMHLVEADYFTPGISGAIVNSKCKPVVFVDPTKPPICDDCVEEAIKKISCAMSKADIDI